MENIEVVWADRAIFTNASKLITSSQYSAPNSTIGMHLRVLCVWTSV